MEALSLDQLGDWSEFLATRPIGFDAEDLHFAHLKWVVAASAGNKGLTAQDFLLRPVPEAEEDDATLNAKFAAAMKQALGIPK